ncbi:hypothetical protein UFOVP118_63 [uncultured Caudovirales phage]|uniref:Uncharacterized protein n=1 Tax=uncultured Caudovirales phage TaxID=2100421 RepID=A0A6J5L7F2_9CAUD|nr:hypothetical protein UFOVP118_63 [uncultured Caudovirales phage]
MAYSGTYDRTSITVDQLISYAYRDAGKQAEEITPEYVNAGKQALFYILQNSVNRGINIWLQKIEVMGPKAYQQYMTLPSNVVDVLEANWIYVQNPAIATALPYDNVNSPVLFDQSANFSLSLHATSTLGENYFGAQYQQQTRLFYVGFSAYSPTGTTTYNLDLEVSDDGVTWQVWQSLDEVTLADQEWAYSTVESTQPFYYYRLKNRDTATTFSIRAIQFAQSQQVIPLARLNRTDYFSLPNKQFPGNRALQYWFNRQIEPQIYFWPVPNNNYQMFQFILELAPQDVGSLTNELYLPNRWIPYIQAALSHKLAMQLPGIDMNRVAYLEKLSLDLRTQAEEEDRDKSPIYFQPNFSYYTR